MISNKSNNPILEDETILLLNLIIYRTLNDQFGVSRQTLMKKSPEPPLEVYN